MTCENSSELINAFIDGILSDEDKKALEVHISTCSACRAKLEDLKKTVGLVKNLNSVVAPPWFAQQVMNCISKEAKRDKSIFGKLFFPLHVKLPVQAVAAVAVAFLVVYVYRAAEPEISPYVYKHKNLAQALQQEKSSDGLKKSVRSDEIARKSAAEAQKEITLQPEGAGAIPPGAPSKSPETTDGLKTEDAKKDESLPAKLEKSSKDAPGVDEKEQQIRLYAGKTIEGKAPEDKPKAEEKTGQDVSVTEHMTIAPPPVMIEISIRVPNRDKAIKDISRVLEAMNARVIGKYSTAEDTALIAEVKSEEVKKIIDKLKLSGDVSQTSKYIQSKGEKAVMRIKIIAGQ